MNCDPLVAVENLSVSFGAPAKRAPRTTVVSGVSFSVLPGQCVAIVGESGSGKSVTARTLLGLEGPNGRVS
ncbi:MAG: ATP-binding cassette domain-containing protein, partial [Microbacterium gubbeenense]